MDEQKFVMSLFCSGLERKNSSAKIRVAPKRHREREVGLDGFELSDLETKGRPHHFCVAYFLQSSPSLSTQVAASELQTGKTIAVDVVVVVVVGVVVVVVDVVVVVGGVVVVVVGCVVVVVFAVVVVTVEVVCTILLSKEPIGPNEELLGVTPVCLIMKYYIKYALNLFFLVNS